MFNKKAFSTTTLSLLTFISFFNISSAFAATSGSHDVTIPFDIIGNTPMYDVEIDVSGPIEWDAKNMTQTKTPTITITNNSTGEVDLSLGKPSTAGDITPAFVDHKEANTIDWTSLSPEECEKKILIKLNFPGTSTNVFDNPGKTTGDDYDSRVYSSASNGWFFARKTTDAQQGTSNNSIGKLYKGKSIKTPIIVKAGRHFASDKSININLSISGSIYYS